MTGAWIQAGLLTSLDGRGARRPWQPACLAVALYHSLSHDAPPGNIR